MRIVVTGLGAVTPLGVGAERSWAQLLAGRSGVRRLPAELAPDVPAQVAGLVPGAEEPGGFSPDMAAPPKDQKKMDRFIQLALAAADEAVAQAGWRPESLEDQAATATVIASGIGGFRPSPCRRSSPIWRRGGFRSGTASRGRSARPSPLARRESKRSATRRG